MTTWSVGAVFDMPMNDQTQSRTGAFDDLREISQPKLAINGSHGVIIYTVNALYLQQNLTGAQLILYPDSNLVRRRRDTVSG